MNLFQDSIRISKNLVFDFEDDSDIPELYDFLDKLVNQVVRSAFFQNEPKDIVNLLKLPLIMPNGLVGKMINTESSKKSIMNNVHHYKSSVFTNFVKMISTDQLNILAIDGMSLLGFGPRTIEVANTVAEKLKSIN